MRNIQIDPISGRSFFYNIEPTGNKFSTEQYAHNEIFVYARSKQPVKCTRKIWICRLSDQNEIYYTIKNKMPIEVISYRAYNNRKMRFFQQLKENGDNETLLELKKEIKDKKFLDLRSACIDKIKNTAWQKDKCYRYTAKENHPSVSPHRDIHKMARSHNPGPSYPNSSCYYYVITPEGHLDPVASEYALEERLRYHEQNEKKVYNKKLAEKKTKNRITRENIAAKRRRLQNVDIQNRDDREILQDSPSNEQIEIPNELTMTAGEKRLKFIFSRTPKDFDQKALELQEMEYANENVLIENENEMNDGGLQESAPNEQIVIPNELTMTAGEKRLKFIFSRTPKDFDQVTLEPEVTHHVNEDILIENESEEKELHLPFTIRAPQSHFFKKQENALTNQAIVSTAKRRAIEISQEKENNRHKTIILSNAEVGLPEILNKLNNSQPKRNFKDNNREVSQNKSLYRSNSTIFQPPKNELIPTTFKNSQTEMNSRLKKLRSSKK